jgi:CheY-like chemotaxis protein
MDKIKYAVVCVDDDSLILQMLSFQLNKIIDSKTTLLECYSDPTTVIDSLDELLDNSIEILIIVVDYQMPKLNGAELIRAVKLKYPSIKCVMLSGQANDLVVKELNAEKQLEQFISKPWDEEKLYQVVRPILDSVA